MVSALALLSLIIAIGCFARDARRDALADVQVHGEGNFGYATSGCQLQLNGLPPDRGHQFPVYRGATDGKWQVLALSFSSDLAMSPPATR
jgi:ketosteroid isomerase-like protein